MFRASVALGLVWIGLGISQLVQGQGELGYALANLAVGVAWLVAAVLRRKGILRPEKRRPPPPNPYQENLP